MQVDRAEFWEFKARCAEADLAIAKARTTLSALLTTKNTLVTAFATAHGCDPARSLQLDDVTFTVSQPEEPKV